MTALYVTLGALGALLLLALLVLFLIAPARGRKARRREVLDHIFAHTVPLRSEEDIRDLEEMDFSGE